jgi:hypothetical protein
MKKYGTIKTVNVIETNEGEVIGVTSFPNTRVGNRDANIFFYDVIKEDDDTLLDEQIEFFVKDGKYEVGDYKAVLVASVY